MVAVHDPASDRILVHGGRLADGSIWELRVDPFVTWTRLVDGEQGPGARWNHSAILDPGRNRLIVHGGEGAAGVFGDTWELRLAGANPRWRVMRTAEQVGPVVAGHAAVLDAARSRMLVLGGAPGGAFTVHELALRGRPLWREVAPGGGPAALSEHTAVVEPAADRVLVHGGFDGAARNATWAFDLAGAGSWSLLAPAGPPARARSRHVAVFDGRRERMVVVAGSGPIAVGHETWALAGASAPRWSRLAPAFESPPAAYGEIVSLRTVFDVNRGKLIALVGRGSSPFGETWTLSFAPDPHWARGASGAARDLDGFFDAARDRVVTFGGFIPTGRTNLTHAFGPGAAIPQWTLVPTGPAPPPIPRYSHVVAYDASRDRMMVFGGSASIGNCTIAVDTYGLTFGSPTSTWAAIPAIPFPEGGMSANGIIDPIGDRFIVQGGAFGCRYPGGHPSGSAADGTWALDLAQPTAWTRLAAPTESPGQVLDAAYDPVGRRMIALQFGAGLAVLPLDPGTETWQMIVPRGLTTTAVLSHAMEYDPGRDRFVVVRNGGQVEFYLPTRTTVHSTAVAEPRHIAADDPDLERTEPPGETLAASGDTFQEFAASTVTRPAALSLAVRSPARGAITLAVTVPAGADARVELHDVRGRLLASRAIAAGTNAEITLDARSLRAGIYFARLRQEREVRLTKVILTRCHARSAPSAFSIAASMVRSPSLTRSPPKPRKLPSFAAWATFCPMSWMSAR